MELISYPKGMAYESSAKTVLWSTTEPMKVARTEYLSVEIEQPSLLRDGLPGQTRQWRGATCGHHASLMA